MMPATLELRCPACGRKAAPAPLMQAATIIVKRTCQGRGCRVVWQLKIRPLFVKPGVAAHEVEWLHVGHATLGTVQQQFARAHKILCSDTTAAEERRHLLSPAVFCHAELPEA